MFALGCTDPAPSVDPEDPAEPAEPDVAWLDDAPDVEPRGTITLVDNLFDADGSSPWLAAWWTTDATPPQPADLPIDTCVRMPDAAPWPAVRSDVAPITVKIGDQEYALMPTPDQPGILGAPIATFPSAGVQVVVVGTDLVRQAPAPLAYDEPVDWMYDLIEPGGALRIAWTPGPSSQVPAPTITLVVIGEEETVSCHLLDDGQATLPASAREPSGWGLMIGREAFTTGDAENGSALLRVAQLRQLTLRRDDDGADD